MEFIETPYFTSIYPYYLSEDEYYLLQKVLSAHPESGNIIKGTGGVRKYRFAYRDKGKRGGVRIIYYWMSADYKIYLFTIYAKSGKENLSDAEKKIIWQLAQEIKNG